jgi:Peptidase family M23
MASELRGARVVDFPLRGDSWVAVTSPGDRIPSHGTDMLGQRYAYDLLKVDGRKGIHVHPAGTLDGWLVGGRTRDSYAWGAPVHSPFDGEVVRAVFAVFAHLAPGSVNVTNGQAVRSGDIIGRVGHTGNSTSAHLHFQLMDSLDLMNAKGIPCAFRSYDVLRDGAWTPVKNGIPRKSERIRVAGDGQRGLTPRPAETTLTTARRSAVPRAPRPGRRPTTTPPRRSRRGPSRRGRPCCRSDPRSSCPRSARR